MKVKVKMAMCQYDSSMPEKSLSPSENPKTAVRLAVAGAVLWTLIVAASLYWGLRSHERQTLEMAYAEARAVRDKDMAFRRWALKHSGVYVRVTPEAQPSPLLSHIPERDVVTTDGMKLTLRAPAMMVREMMDDYVAMTGGARGRIVGLRFLNPINAPDTWEKKQLEEFELGIKNEVWEIAEIDGKPYLRYLKAWFMEEGCVRCHGILGYQVGDMRGATGVNLPLEPYYQRIRATAIDLGIGHGVIWLVGLVGIGWVGRQGYQRALERQAMLRHIEHLAYHDALTGLDNRYSLRSRLDQALATARREGNQLAVVLIDMDRFKNINDTLGHHVGDQLLIEVGHRLQACVRESDIVARLGGDEFVVVLTGLAEESHALNAGTKLLEALAKPYQLDGQMLHSTPSIGISLFPRDGQDAGTLLKHADAAMYHAKEHGRNQLHFFTEDLTWAAAERMELERDLRTVLDSASLQLYFQPQVEARSGRIVGFEALVRWQHPQRGWVSPERFVAIAEEAGLIGRLGQWVLEEGCRQLAAWRAAGVSNVRLALNLSAHQLRDTALGEEIRAALVRHGLAAGDLELEITETVAMADPEEAVRQLGALRDLGVAIAIDDFGTGYSSLAYLKRLPIQVLKIDRAFVSDLESDANDAAICSATIALAKSLGLRVVAEGVETQAQRDFLVRLGCDVLQGYLFGKPLPGEECLALIKRQ